MKVSSLVFACHSKACAPPPVGTGGSSGGGKGRKSISSPSAAYNEVKIRSQRGEKMTRAKIKEAWERNTTPGPAKDKGPKLTGGELRRGGTETLKGMGSWNGGKLGRYKNGQYYVKPPASTGHKTGPIPLAARSRDKAYDEIHKKYTGQR